MNIENIEYRDATDEQMLVKWIGLLFDSGAKMSEQGNVLIGEDEYSKEDLIKNFDCSIKNDKQNDLLEKVAACLDRYKEKNNQTIERERQDVRTELRALLSPLTVSEWLEQNQMSQYYDALMDLPDGVIVENSAKSLMKVTEDDLTTIGIISPEERRLWNELLEKYFGNNNEEKEDPKSWIGCNCQVWITDDDDWKPGKVTKYVAELGKHIITYEDDKSTEEIDIKQRIEDEEFEWISFSWSKEFLTMLKDIE